MITDFPSVSVIIPVFSAVEPIEDCLIALDKQTYPKNRYEVIVVSNNPDIREFESFKEKSEVVFLHESSPGSYSARNLGIKKAKGKVIAFTDADCIPDENWLKEGVINLLNIQNCGLLAGKLIVFCRDNTNPTSTEIYETLNAFPQKLYIEKGHFGVTANLFTFREVFEDVGLFNEQLISSGDKEWG
ncbi:MAG: glycosyltransferase family A protein, partial [Cyanobacteria bacterium P01_G01_bin.49]